MKKILLISAFICAAFCNAAAQADFVKSQTDSLTSFFEAGLSGVKYAVTELVKNPDDVFADANNEITGDTVNLEHYEDFKFYRTRQKDSLFVAEYFRGHIGKIFEKELTVYYFLSGRLAMTVLLSVKHGESLDDGLGTYYFYQERRLLFPRSKDGFPSYITRDGEGTSESFNIKTLPFKQIDVRKIVYDKYNFEIIGGKIFNGKTDF